MDFEDTAPIQRPPLSKSERAYVDHKLHSFALRQWHKKNGDKYLHLPAIAIWSGTSLADILKNLHLLRTITALQECLHDWPYLDEDGEDLFAVINGINERLDTRYRKKRARAVAREEATRAQNQAAKTEPSETETSEHCAIHDDYNADLERPAAKIVPNLE